MTLNEVKSEVFEFLNSSKGVAYGTFDGNPNYKNDAITQAVIDADYQVAVALASTDGHPRRAGFIKSGTLTNGAEPAWLALPESDSQIEGLMITKTSNDVVPATMAPGDKIKIWSSSPAEFGGVDVIEGYAAVYNNTVLFSGVSLAFKHFKVDAHTGTPTNLKTPDVFRPTVVKLASAFFLAKMGSFLEVANWAESLARTDIQNIKMDKYFVPAAFAVQRSE